MRCTFANSIAVMKTPSSMRTGGSAFHLRKHPAQNLFDFDHGNALYTMRKDEDLII